MATDSHNTSRENVFPAFLFYLMHLLNSAELFNFFLLTYMEPSKIILVVQFL